jgi:hypothetical protein
MSSQQVLDLVDHARPSFAGVLPQRGQPPALLIGRRRQLHLPQAVDRLPSEKAVTIDPQQFAQRRRITLVGLRFLPLFRLNQDHLATQVFFQRLEQPIVEPTDFHHRQECISIPEKFAVQLLKELFDLLRRRRDLTRLHHIPLLVPQGNRELAGMLIDSKIKHRRAPPV